MARSRLKKAASRYAWRKTPAWKKAIVYGVLLTATDAMLFDGNIFLRKTGRISKTGKSK